MSAPLPVAAARDQRFENGGVRGSAGCDIDNGHADARQAPSGPPVIEASPLSA